MGEGEFACELRERDAGTTGADEAVFLVRPNAGLPFGPVAETASGGELSRIALAIAAVAGARRSSSTRSTPASAVDRKRRRGGAEAPLGARQVITITHLPQIAALADRHFQVEKVPATRRTRASSSSRRRAECRA